MAIPSSLLYQISAVINAVSVPGHTLMGLQSVYPALDTIAVNSTERKKAVAGARNGWDYVHAGLAVAGE
jgi:hypothetical protein